MFKIYIYVTVFVITCICVTKCENQPNHAVSPQVQYCVTPRNVSIYANLLYNHPKIHNENFLLKIQIGSYFKEMSAMAALGKLWQ